MSKIQMHPLPSELITPAIAHIRLLLTQLAQTIKDPDRRLHSGGPYQSPFDSVPHQKFKGRNRNFPTLITWEDQQGKLHIPPDPPLFDGCPAWSQRPNEYRRVKHLKKCPSKTCRKAKRCAAPHAGQFCQITHMSAETHRRQLANRLAKILRAHGITPASQPKPSEIPDPPPAYVKNYLQKASDAGAVKALLEIQTKWIEEQKRSSAKEALTSTLSTPRQSTGSSTLTLPS